MAKNVKSPSNPIPAGQFTAEIAGLREDHKGHEAEPIEDTNLWQLIGLVENPYFYPILFYVRSIDPLTFIRKNPDYANRLDQV